MKKKFLVMAVAMVLLLTMSLVLLTACDGKEYTVTVYDTDGTTVLETYTLKKGDSLSEKELTFSKNDSTFFGVYTDKEFTTKYTPSAVTGALSLYAKFSKDTYYIIFVNNGGEAIANKEVKNGESFTLPTPAARTGYVFNGWTLDGEAFESGVYSKTQSITLRSSWTAKSTAVSFDANGGDVIMQGASTFTYGSAISLPAVQREGYNFGGWAKEGETTAYTFGTTWADDSANLAFKAIWTTKTTKVTFTLNGGVFTTAPEKDSEDNYFVNINYGANYTLPEATKAGYTLKWVDRKTNSEVAASDTWENTAATVRLVANWTPNPYRVTFDAKEGTCSTASVNTKFNEEIGALPTPAAPEGYIFDGWYYKVNNVDTKINANTVHSVVGDIAAFAKYDKATNIVYTVEIYLENANDTEYFKYETLTKRGETGATVDGTTVYTGATAYMEFNTVKSAATKSGEIAADGSLVLKLYYDRKEYTVTIAENGGNDVNNITAKYGAAITAPTVTRTGYKFDGWDVTFPAVMPLNGTTITAEWTANVYKLYLDTTNGLAYLAADGVKFENGNAYIEVAYDAVNFTIPAPSAIDYTFAGWKLGTADFSNAKWTALNDQTIKATWTKAGADFITDDTNKYFKEYDGTEYIYVFVDGVEPSFGTSTLSVEGAAASLVGGKLTCNAIGSFTLTITDTNGRARTVKAEYVDYVGMFQRGADYVSNWVNRVAENYLNAADETRAVMQVGTANGFKPDMVIDNGVETINCSAANIIFKLYEGDTELTAGFTFSNGELRMDDALVGKTLKIEISPKYYLNGTAPKAEFNILVNDGYNVYDSNSFKLAYENTANKTINILRNFKIVLTEDKYGNNGGNRYVINDFDHCAYVRYADENETVTVNCNYFTIDGSNLPYFDNRYDGYSFMGVAAAINNVQSAIFGYSGLNKTATASFPNAKLIINDMYLQGNNNDKADFSDAQSGSGLPIYKMSGSYNGVRVQNCGDLQLDNCTIKNTLIAVYTSANGGKSTYTGSDYVISHEVGLNYTLIDNSWANAVYALGNTHLTLTNSQLYKSSGAVVHFEDLPDANYTGVSNVTIDANTIIANYVTGEEAWFVAYGMNSMIPTLKSSLNTAAQGVTNAATSGTIIKGIIKKYDGNESEYFNFAVFSRSGGGESSEWNADPQQGVKMDVIYGETTLAPQTIAENTKATITTDLKYIDFELNVAGVGQTVFFLTLE